MFKEFFLKKLVQSKLKGSGISEDQQNKLVEMISKNPELFKKIAEEAQNLVEINGIDPAAPVGTGQMRAIMQVAQKYKSELGDLAKDFKN